MQIYVLFVMFLDSFGSCVLSGSSIKKRNFDEIIIILQRLVTYTWNENHEVKYNFISPRKHTLLHTVLIKGVKVTHFFAFFSLWGEISFWSLKSLGNHFNFGMVFISPDVLCIQH